MSTKHDLEGESQYFRQFQKCIKGKSRSCICHSLGLWFSFFQDWCLCYSIWVLSDAFSWSAETVQNRKRKRPLLCAAFILRRFQTQEDSQWKTDFLNEPSDSFFIFLLLFPPNPPSHSTACMIFILDISFYSGLPSPFFNPLGWIERSCSLSCWLNWKKVLPLQHDPRRSHGMFLLDIVRFAAKTRMCWLILGEAPFPSSAKPELSAMGRSLWGHTQKRTAQCFWKQLAKTPLGLSSHPPHFFLSQWISGKHRCVIYLVLYNKFSQTTDLKQYTFIIWYFYRLGIHTQLSWVLFQTIL